MAATGRPLVDVILQQNAQVLDEQGVTGDEREQGLARIREALDRVGSDEDLDDATLGDEERAMLPMRAWLQSHAKQDPMVTIARLSMPVLLLQGAEDFQVSVEADARALEAALELAGHHDYQLVVLPGLDHLFKPVPEGETSTLKSYYEDRRVSEKFLGVLSSWLLKRMR
jgi:pimeloyl-ACP methyl ester carboxylesterase